MEFARIHSWATITFIIHNNLQNCMPQADVMFYADYTCIGTIGKPVDIASGQSKNCVNKAE